MVTSMRALVLTAHGGPECLSLRDDVPVPRPTDGDVLVRVAAAAVNNTDINTRLGWYEGGGWTGAFPFPRIQGIDACGYVVAVGDGVDPARIGERVLVEPCWRGPEAPFSTARFFGSEVDGAFADFTVVPARHAHTVRSSLSDADLASFPCSYSTAENMLCRADVRAGERIFVTGASGGVGSAAVQLATARGAEVHAAAGRSKHSELLQLGCASVVERDADLPVVFGDDSFDAVVDVVGGPLWPSLLRVLRPGGRLAAAGAVGGPTVPLDLRTLYLKDLQLLGCTVLGTGVFASLVERIEREEVRPLVAATFPLERMADAQDLFLTKQHLGKIAIQVGAD